jgi:hypothetical protein
MGEARKRQFVNDKGELEYKFFKGKDYRNTQGIFFNWKYSVIRKLSKGWFRKHRHLFKDVKKDITTTNNSQFHPDQEVIIGKEKKSIWMIIKEFLEKLFHVKKITSKLS